MNPSSICSLEVIDGANYEYILYRGENGRLFLMLSHESGFITCDQTFELEQNEIKELNSNKSEFIKKARATFNHSNRQFEFFGNSRAINNFRKWPSWETAIKDWHLRIKNT